MQSLKRATVASAVLVAALIAAVLYFSPSAARVVGIGTGNINTSPESFTYDGFKIQLAGAYADSYSTVVDVKGAPSGVVFGGTYLTDQFANIYPQEDAEQNNTGDMALSYKPAMWLTAATGMRYTLNVERVSQTTVTGVLRLSGIVLFNTARRLWTPTSGSFGNGTVTFSEVRYGARVVAVQFDVRGVSVVGGYPPSEASVKPRPRLQVRLVPFIGGAAKNMPYHTSVSGDVTQVHAIAMLVDPGTYTLTLSLEGVAELQRTLTVS